MLRRVLAIVSKVSWVIATVFFSLVLPQECVGQSASSQGFDYESLAIDSILSVADEASKLPDIEQKVPLLISAAKLLPASKRDDAIRLLDIALADLKDWEGSEKAGWGRRYKAATLRNEIFSAYAKLDSKKALALQKQSASQADSDASDVNRTARPLRNQDWNADMLERQQRASEAAKIALTIIETDFERAAALVLQSVSGGVVPPEIFDIFQKLKQLGNRAALNRLEAGMGEALSRTATFDPASLQFASILVQSDRDMPSAARSGFILYFMKSLRMWVNLSRDGANGGLDTPYLGSTFLSFFRSVRPAIAQYLPPEDLFTFDLLLEEVAPLLPAQAKARLQLASAETISNPRDRLADILRESNTSRRDFRLMRFALDSVRNSTSDALPSGLELASDSISHISDESLKTTLNDFVAITRVNLLAKGKKFTDAQRLAESLSTPESRAWTMLALSSVIPKEDSIRAYGLIGSAVKTLDSAAAGARKVELALLAAAMLARKDPLRAFEMLSVAARYANSSWPKGEESDNDPSSALRLEVSIGSMSTMLGRVPESTGEIEIDPSLALLGEANHWFQSQPIVGEFRDTQLRLLLKLKLAEGALAHNSKQKKDAAQKPPVR